MGDTEGQRWAAMRGRLAHLIRQFSAMPYESAQRFLDAEAAGLVDELVPRARLSQVEGERDALAAGVERAHHFLDEWRSAKQGSTEELRLVNNAYNAASEAKVSAAPILRMRELGLRNALDAERAARQAAEAHLRAVLPVAEGTTDDPFDDEDAVREARAWLRSLRAPTPEGDGGDGCP